MSVQATPSDLSNEASPLYRKRPVLNMELIKSRLAHNAAVVSKCADFFNSLNKSLAPPSTPLERIKPIRLRAREIPPQADRDMTSEQKLEAERSFAKEKKWMETKVQQIGSPVIQKMIVKERIEHLEHKISWSRLRLSALQAHIEQNRRRLCPEKGEDPDGKVSPEQTYEQYHAPNISLIEKKLRESEAELTELSNIYKDSSASKLSSAAHQLIGNG